MKSFIKVDDNNIIYEAGKTSQITFRTDQKLKKKRQRPSEDIRYLSAYSDSTEEGSREGSYKTVHCNSESFLPRL